jgi:hypothetical protein
MTETFTTVMACRENRTRIALLQSKMEQNRRLLKEDLEQALLRSEEVLARSRALLARLKP